ncbi:pyrroloquinoline quinone biosynthesis peptide chaperone PqqD [Saccharopolyspora taberi]|uniref:Pyrroloquinoline quinone biosynthesis peptide chaperone PqqD n=1 Tax=Saccharopolyspora taberi TaxID=60895 RepID=A0ABN3VGT7_9PSEU
MKPRLRRGVRLSYDHVRQRTVVLHPEGVVMPNETALAVLERCDGRTTAAGIAAALGEIYRGVRQQDVDAVVERMRQRGLLEMVP